MKLKDQPAYYRGSATRTVRVNGYDPWTRIQPSCAMLYIVDGEEGRLIPFATVIEVGCSVEASGEVG